MMKALKRFLRRTRIYHAFKRRRTASQRKREVLEWQAQGRPAPPPHVVKQKAIRDLAREFGLKTLVETGTYYGDMVEAMRFSFHHIYSIELSRELYQKARERFSGDRRISLIQGDSGVELGTLVPTLEGPALFWLDGHYSAGVTAKGDKETPIFEELTHILGSPEKRHVILIDDARCFGTDPAYPSLAELYEFIKGKRPEVRITVSGDAIRITP